MKHISKINLFMLQKRNAMIVDTKDYANEKNIVSPNVVFGALANLETWAYTADTALVAEFLKLSEDVFINKYYNPLVSTLKYLKGDDVSHDHFVFQNFPDSCKEIDLNTLSEMRFARYYTVLIDEYLGTDLTSKIMDGKKPEYVERPELKKDELSIIKSADIEAFYELNRNLIGSKSAMSSLDKEIVDFAIKSNDIPNDKIIPKEIPYKETMALMFQYDMEKHLNLNIKLSSYKDFKRVLAILSNAEASSKKPQLRTFTLSEKRYLLSKLEEATNTNPDVVKSQMYADRHYVYHLGEYWKINYKFKSTIPKTEMIFRMIKDNQKIKTIEKLKGEAIKNKDSIALLNILKQSPGELYRYLYFMLDNSKSENETNQILRSANENALKVPNNILLATRSEIMASKDMNFIKTAFPHGNTRKAFQYENKRRPLKDSVISAVDKICCDAVISRLSTKLDYSDKKIYIDESMKKCPVPFGVKDESNSTRTLTKGTRFYIDGLKHEKDVKESFLGYKKETNDYLRLFVYKKIQQGGFVDLSISFLDKDCQMIDQCSWTNLKTDNTGKPLAVHSGDGHDCQKGLSEFIDIDLEQLDKYSKDNGIKYVAMQVLSWNKIPFNQMDRCFAGFMKCSDMIKSRVDVSQRHKIFDPKMVKDKMDLTGSELICMPFIYDVEKREVIVSDIALPSENLPKKIDLNEDQVKIHQSKLYEYADRCCISRDSVLNMPTVESCASVTAHVARNIINNHFPNLYDLYTMAAVAGDVKIENIVTSKEDADISFTWDGTITPYDRDIITATYMTVEDEYMTQLKESNEKMDAVNDRVRSGYNNDMFIAIQNIDEVKKYISEKIKTSNIEK